MLGMAVLLVVVSERERIGEMRSRLGELALDRALARVHLCGDLRGGQVEVIAEDGDLALAAGERRQRVNNVDPIARRAFERRWRRELGPREAVDAEPAEPAPRQVEGDGRDPSVERGDLIAALAPLPGTNDGLLDRVLRERE